METEFVGFPKIGRLSREVIVTEKIDGTNGQILIEAVDLKDIGNDAAVVSIDIPNSLVMRVGSRTRWIKPGDDNFGFAGWCKEHADELFTLGQGRHFGEWWGAGIQRRYGLTEKRFSLFNTGRWMDTHSPDKHKLCYEGQEWAPDCCHVVPILYRGNFDNAPYEHLLGLLRQNGSAAAPGFMKPEGIVVFHIAANVGFKKTIEKDEQWKGKQ